MTAKKNREESFEEKRVKEEQENFVNFRKRRFQELLGKDCEYIDRLVINVQISTHDVEDLIKKGCPKELIPNILL